VTLDSPSRGSGFQTPSRHESECLRDESERHLARYPGALRACIPMIAYEPRADYRLLSPVKVHVVWTPAESFRISVRGPACLPARLIMEYVCPPFMGWFDKMTNVPSIRIHEKSPVRMRGEAWRGHSRHQMAARLRAVSVADAHSKSFLTGASPSRNVASVR
jgi:hypothetical protein